MAIEMQFDAIAAHIYDGANAEERAILWIDGLQFLTHQKWVRGAWRGIEKDFYRGHTQFDSMRCIPITEIRIPLEFREPPLSGLFEMFGRRHGLSDIRY